MTAKTFKQRATPQLMKIVNRRDRNTRGLAKVVSALEWIIDSNGDTDAIGMLDCAKFELIQERRNLGCALLNELDLQAKVGSGGAR
jgi:hypothetical protein